MRLETGHLMAGFCGDGRMSATMSAPRQRVGLAEVLVSWGRIGCLGFGGPPAHIAMLRQLCVDRQHWIEPAEFEDSIAACNLLPGPASTQLAILSAWNVAGVAGALVGGLAFILPGFVAVLVLSAVFFASAPPDWVLAAGAGAGAAVPAVALHAGATLVPASWGRARSHARWIAYGLLGAISAATIGPWLVLVLLGCGLVELAVLRRQHRLSAHAPVLLAAAAGVATGGLTALAWVAFKVGALSYGGGFVIIPLMHHDAVQQYGWMTESQFLDAVALGQITPGPVTHTVAAVGYAAAGVGGALLAAAVAFAPSFIFVLAGARHFQAFRRNTAAQAFLSGAGPAAIGAILGVAIPLARALDEAWQFGVLAAAVLMLLVLRRGIVVTLLLAAAVGVIAVELGAPLP
jgi:chromate transporter